MPSADQRAAASAKAAVISGMASRANLDVLNAGRDVVARSSKLWRRVADADPCGFCAMLAGRGPVYRSAEKAGAGMRWHSHCGCTVEPFEGDPSDWEPTPGEQRFIDGYDEVFQPGMAPEQVAAKLQEWLATNPLAEVTKSIDWASARTAEDVERLLQNAIGDRGTVSGFAGRDVGKSREAARKIAELMERFPEIRADIIVQAEKNQKVFARAGGDMVRLPDGTEVAQNLRLILSQSKLSKTSKIDAMMKGSAEVGWFRILDPSGVRSWWDQLISHEFGHIIDYASMGRSTLRGPLAGSRTNIVSAMESMLRERGIRPISKEANALMNEQMSKYGRSNQFEARAEAFADVETNGDGATELSKRLVAAMLDALRDAVA